MLTLSDTPVLQNSWSLQIQRISFNAQFWKQMAEDGSTLLKRMEITVAEAEKRTGKKAVNMQETYTVYLLETR